MTNLIQNLETVMRGTSFRYRGCIIEKTGNRYYALGKPHATLFLAQSTINNACKVIQLSIVNPQTAA